jgi:hypothetical protein
MTREEPVMSRKIQEAGVSAETLDAGVHANAVAPEPFPGAGLGPLTAPQPVRTATDQEYVNSMEERYGISEEGFF